MITNTARNFVEALEDDPTLQAHFLEATLESLDGVLDFANTRGFVFTVEELETALKGYPDNSIVRQLRQHIHTHKTKLYLAEMVKPLILK